MTETFKHSLWQNFGAAIEMLENAIRTCPDELWYNDRRFYYISYHTIIFLDYYLTIPARDFQPALPYTLTAESKLPPEAVDDVLPGKYYSKEEMLRWLLSIRTKCKDLITHATEASLTSRWIDRNEINLHGLCASSVIDYSVLEILFYNFRHVQHHVAQLNFILRQKTGTAPGWVSRVDK